MVRPSGAVALAAWDCVIDTQVSRPVSANVGVPKFCPPEAFVHSQGGSSAARVDVPEAVRRPHSVKFDMWSLGVLCCVALGGKQPFMGSNEEQLQAKICGEDPQIPGFIAPLERDLIERLLQKEPAERPTALEVLAHPFVTKCLTPEERCAMRDERGTRDCSSDCWSLHDQTGGHAVVPRSSDVIVIIQVSLG